jgi:hypothetical protein
MVKVILVGQRDRKIGIGKFYSKKEPKENIIHPKPRESILKTTKRRLKEEM